MPSEKHKAADRKYYLENAEIIKRKSREWYNKNKERRKRKVKEYIETHRELHHTWTKIWRSRTLVKNQEKARAKHQRDKQIVFDHYGNGCACCGEDLKEFLTIDHIFGGGNKHRKLTRDTYRWLIKNNFPEGFRLLCMNCNFSIGKFGYCPHRHKK